MSKRLVLLAALLSLPPAFAIAEDAPSPDVPCVGPMCLLTPFYKLGTMMPDMHERSPAPPPAKATETPQAQSPQSATEPAPATASQGKPDQEAPDQGDTAKAAADAADHEAAPTSEPSKPRRLARRATANRSIPHRARVASRAAHPSRSADPTVTIAANATEIDRLLRLAAVVKDPPIEVIPAVALVNGCHEKPADFVVDTMTSPNRVGPAIPLFTESLVILARQDVHDLAGLRGRQVSYGLGGGSSQLVAERVFRSLAIDVHEVPLDLDNALDGLTTGDIDAVALLVPRGFDRLANHDSKLHLLTLPDRMSPPDGLKLSRIDPSSYLGGSWPMASLQVVTVDAVLSPSRAVAMQPNAQAVYAALDRRSFALAEAGFDLIGGSGLRTMRSTAEDPAPGALPRRPSNSGC